MASSSSEGVVESSGGVLEWRSASSTGAVPPVTARGESVTAAAAAARARAPQVFANKPQARGLTPLMANLQLVANGWVEGRGRPGRAPPLGWNTALGQPNDDSHNQDRGGRLENRGMWGTTLRRGRLGPPAVTLLPVSHSASTDLATRERGRDASSVLQRRGSARAAAVA